MDLVARYKVVDVNNADSIVFLKKIGGIYMRAKIFIMGFSLIILSMTVNAQGDEDLVRKNTAGQALQGKHGRDELNSRVAHPFPSPTPPYTCSP